MNTFEITVTEFNEDFVKYNYSAGGSGMSGRKWFQEVAVGQVWQMSCSGALVITCTRLQ